MQVGGVGSAEVLTPSKLIESKQKLNKSKKDKVDKTIREIGKVKSNITSLRTTCMALQKTDLINKKSVSFLNEDQKEIQVEAASSVLAGEYSVKVKQLASASRLEGAVGISNSLAANQEDFNALKIKDLALSVSITKGSFTVNGAKIEIDVEDTMGDVFNKISTETNGEVTASYDSAEDKIKLTSTSEKLELGVANDKSNFLKAFNLYANNTNTVSSTHKLGTVQLYTKLGEANLKTNIDIPNSDSGTFKVNGIEFTYNSDSRIGDIIEKINRSEANVSAFYDKYKNRLVIKNKATGSLDIAAEDVDGNFLSAMGLNKASAQLEKGQNAKFSINGGDEIVSLSNKFTGDSHGIRGLVINAKTLPKDENGDVIEKDTIFYVKHDYKEFKEKIQEFVKGYNAIQDHLENNTKHTKNTVNGRTTYTKEPLRGTKISELQNELRASLSSTIKVSDEKNVHSLSNIGISSEGYTKDRINNQIKLDEKVLDSILEASPDQVLTLFTKQSSASTDKQDSSQHFDENKGLAFSWYDKLDHYINNELKSTKEIYESQRKSLEARSERIQKNAIREAAKNKKAIEKIMLSRQKIQGISSFLSNPMSPDPSMMRLD